ncbi:MAG: TrkA family potassium uptake protein [Myxococcota bacterium]|nr:TrkA family potassium uptake protein [Myxococcota bacterium]
MYGVIGLGQFGTSAAAHLRICGQEVIAADVKMGRVENIKDDVSRAVCLDSTDEQALRAAGFDDCRGVLMALGERNLEAAVTTAMALVEMKIPHIVSRAANDLQAKILTKLGVHHIVFPEKRAGTEVARQLISPNLDDIVVLKDGLVLAELELPKKLRKHTLVEFSWPKRFSITVAGCITEEAIHTWKPAPNAAQPLDQCSKLAVVGTAADIRKFAHYFHKESKET